MGGDPLQPVGPFKGVMALIKAGYLDNLLLAVDDALGDVHLYLFPMGSLPESLAWFREQADRVV